MTFKQMVTLYEHTQKREESRMIFDAALQGVDLKKHLSVLEDQGEPVQKTKFDPTQPIFKDPSVYKHMSDEEKEAKTQEMMGFLKGLVHDPDDKLRAPRKYFSGMRM